MIDINSTNRGAAKKLLTLLGHDAVATRIMTLAQLSAALHIAINQGLITEHGAQRALSIKLVPPKEYDHKDGRDHEVKGKPEEKNAKDGDSEEQEEKGEDDSEQDNEGDSQEDDSESEEQEEQKDSEQEQEQEEQKDSEQEQEQEDDGKPIEHPMLDRIKKYIAAGLNVALVGPAGTGKSFIARQVAEALDLPFYGNGALMSKYDLTGFCDAHGTYHSTPAYDAFVTGGLHCFDELDASAPDAVVAFNGMTDDQPFYTFPNGQQVKHADYVAIACMNTWGNGATSQYVGRYKQDAAAMDRFVRVFIDYDARIENRIGTASVVTRVRAVRKACEALAIQHVCSYRMIKKATLAFTQGVNKTAIDADIIFAGLDASAVTQIKAHIKTQGVQ